MTAHRQTSNRGPSATGASTVACGRRQRGAPTSALITSTHVGDSAELFRRILDLHVPHGASILDVTFGLGAFWKQVDLHHYRLLGSDLVLKPETRKRFPTIELRSGADFRKLPDAPSSYDAVVFDPPYMEGLYRPKPESRAGQGTHHAFQHAYSSGAESGCAARPRGRLAWQDRVVDAYVDGIGEAHRVLVPEGRLIVKCQDAISANLQRLAHVEILLAAETLGFYCKDLFVLVRPNSPAVSRMVRQEHARKNHSYFLVFERTSRNPVASSCRRCRGEQKA